MKRFCFHPVREQKFRIVKISSGDAYPSSLTVILYSACSLRNHSLATRMYTSQFLNRRYRKRKREKERSIGLTTTSVTDGARRLYRRTRSIGLILANWDKTMICGLIDSSIWQSDQQVRRRDFSLSELSGAIYCISRPGLCTFSRRDVNDVERSREFSSTERFPSRRRNGKYNVNANQQVCDDEYSLFTGCTLKIDSIVLCLSGRHLVWRES